MTVAFLPPHFATASSVPILREISGRYFFNATKNLSTISPGLVRRSRMNISEAASGPLFRRSQDIWAYSSRERIPLDTRWATKFPSPARRTKLCLIRSMLAWRWHWGIMAEGGGSSMTGLRTWQKRTGKKYVRAKRVIAAAILTYSSVTTSNVTFRLDLDVIELSRLTRARLWQQVQISLVSSWSNTTCPTPGDSWAPSLYRDKVVLVGIQVIVRVLAAFPDGDSSIVDGRFLCGSDAIALAEVSALTSRLSKKVEHVTWGQEKSPTGFPFWDRLATAAASTPARTCCWSCSWSACN